MCLSFSPVCASGEFLYLLCEYWDRCVCRCSCVISVSLCLYECVSKSVMCVCAFVCVSWSHHCIFVFPGQPSASAGSVKLVVVGGGAGGVELALSMQARLRKELESRGSNSDAIKVSLIARSATLMPSHNKQVGIGLPFPFSAQKWCMCTRIVCVMAPHRSSKVFFNACRAL